jgi:hypothetical protein
MHRQLFIYAPFYYLFIAKGIEGINNKKFQIIILSCVFGLMAPAIFNYYCGLMFEHPSVPTPNILVGTLPKKNYRDMMSYMSE